MEIVSRISFGAFLAPVVCVIADIVCIIPSLRPVVPLWVVRWAVGDEPLLFNLGMDILLAIVALWLYGWAKSRVTSQKGQDDDYCGGVQ